MIRGRVTDTNTEMDQESVEFVLIISAFYVVTLRAGSTCLFDVCFDVTSDVADLRAARVA